MFKGWTKSANWEWDAAVMRLDCSIGNTVGYFGYFYTTDSLLDRPLRIDGSKSIVVVRPLSASRAPGAATIRLAFRSQCESPPVPVDSSVPGRGV